MTLLPSHRFTGPITATPERDLDGAPYPVPFGPSDGMLPRDEAFES